MEYNLTGILASIIRHSDTEYNNIISNAGKRNARFYVGGIINEELRSIRGEDNVKGKRCYSCKGPLELIRNFGKQYRVVCKDLNNCCTAGYPGTWESSRKKAVASYYADIENSKKEDRESGQLCQ